MHKSLSNSDVVACSTTPNDGNLPRSEALGLLEIPLEILGQLFQKYLSSDDRFQLRQVNSICNLLVDDYIGFKISLNNDDPKPKFDFVSEVAIRKATLHNINVISQEDTCDEQCSSIPKTQMSVPVFDQIFLYPEYLQEVVMKGRIDAEFLNEIVRKCEVLKMLELSTDCNITSSTSEATLPRQILPEVDIFSTTPSNKYFLPKCKILKLMLNQDSTISSTLNSEAVLAIMKSTRSQCLEKAVLQGWISEQFSVSRITLLAAECLEQNPTIQSFFAGILYTHLIENDEPISSEDLELRPLIQKKLSNASKWLNIKKFGLSTRSSDMMLWKDFLKGQGNLVHVSFTVDLLEGTFTSEMFKSCRDTLTQFILRGKFRSSFDFSWIEDCHNLKEVCLHNLEVDEHNAAVHIANFASAPIGLESLVLFQTVARTDDIIVTLKRLTQLETLVLFKTGNVAGETGVNSECLRLICNCRTLHSALLVRFVAGNAIEATQLVKILQTMNDGELHREISAAPEIIPAIPDAPPHDHDVDGMPSLEDIVQVEEACGGKVSDIQISNCVPLVPLIDESCSNSNQEVDPLQIPSQSDNKNNIEEGGENINNNFKAVSILQSTPEPDIQTCTTNPVNEIGEAAGRTIIGDVKPEVDNMEPHLLTKVPNENKKPLPQEFKEFQHVEPSNMTHSVNLIDQNPFEIPHDLENLAEAEDQEWIDVDDDDDYSLSTEEDEGIFDLDIDELHLDAIEEVVAAAADGQNFQLILNLQNEADLEEMLGLLGPVAADNLINNNIVFGFVLDGVIDIMDKNTKRSHWVAVEDEDGHLSYTLRSSID